MNKHSPTFPRSRRPAPSLPNGKTIREMAPSRLDQAVELIEWEQRDGMPETTGTGHLHWVIQAYTQRMPNGSLNDVVQVSVEAPDEEHAIARAQAIIDRPLYRVISVSEACSFSAEFRDKE